MSKQTNLLVVLFGTFLVRSVIGFCLPISVVGLVSVSVTWGQAGKPLQVAYQYDKTTNFLSFHVDSEMSTGANWVTLESFLDSRADNELKAINKACSLTEAQNVGLSLSFSLDNRALVKVAKDLAIELENAPESSTNKDRIAVVEAYIHQCLPRLRAISVKMRECYFLEGKLSRKFLESKLDRSQQKQLHEFYFNRVLVQVFDKMKLNDEQRVLVKEQFAKLDTRKEYTFDPKVHLQYLASFEFKDLMKVLAPKMADDFFMASLTLLTNYERTPIVN